MKRLIQGLAMLVATSAFCAELKHFVLLGDTPYSARERQAFPGMLAEIVASTPDFIIHVGDFKLSKDPCSDALFEDRRRLFDTSPVPFIYLPGDNEWTDCKRWIAGHYSEEERLATIRQLFFSNPESLGKTRLPVERQSAVFPEHLRWRSGPVIFLTLNVPGPDNNIGRKTQAKSEFKTRNAAVIDWVKQGFALAHAEKRAAIVIAMQANPGFKEYAAGFPHRGFRELLDTLRDGALSFPGQVLLLQGDTHWQRVDHPLRVPGSNRRIANFTRAESFGYPFMGWVDITVDADDPAFFRFTPHPLPRHFP